MQDDRLVGAILAGLPTIPAPSEKGRFFGIANAMHDPWIYDGTPTVLERAYGTFQIGQKSSPLNVGLRDHSMRTPGQYQQNFPRELAITEAAVLAGSRPASVSDSTRARETGHRRARIRSRRFGWQTRSERSGD